MIRGVTMARRTSRFAALSFLVAAGCATMSRPAPTPPPPVPTPVVIPTVPPGTPTPGGGATPLPTRPIENPAAAKAKAEGKAIGPVITFFGIARADGKPIEPESKTRKGTPIFVNYVGSGFILVVEGKPGISNLEVGRRLTSYDPKDPSIRSDLEVEVTRPLGDGSPEVCDARRPHIGGIPAVKPPSFAETGKIAATLVDFSCRFETFIQSSESCTLNSYGDFSFVAKDTATQFCMVVARAWNFPKGDTLVSARLRDERGNPGPVSHFILRRPERPTPKPRPRLTPTPTIPRRRP
jgi:hypothetical protein